MAALGLLSLDFQIRLAGSFDTGFLAGVYLAKRDYERYLKFAAGTKTAVLSSAKAEG